MTLCLRVGAHDEDFVDAYIGSAALKEEALAEWAARPARPSGEALALLEAVPGPTAMEPGSATA